MEIVLSLLFIGGIAWFLIRRQRRRSGGARFRCVDCQYLRRADQDGVICGYGDSEVFKNPVHISMCMNYQKKG